MFSSLEEIIQEGPARPEHGARRSQRAKRTGQPVRRQSRAKGRCEGLFWQRITRQEAARIRLAAERYELATRQRGARNGALGTVALEVISYLTRLVDYRTGRLDPSLDYLMAKLKRSRDAITRALKALRAHGFLDWLRRFEPTGIEGRGPQVRQVSNAYRLFLPQKALQWLGRLGLPTPLPDDFIHAQERQRAEIEAHKASLSLAELPLFELGSDDPLGRALSRLGRLVQERESAKRSESPSPSIL